MGFVGRGEGVAALAVATLLDAAPWSAASALLLLALVPAAAASARPAAEKPAARRHAVIGFDGVGAIELGMTIDEARKASRRGIVAGSESRKAAGRTPCCRAASGSTTLRFDKKFRVLYVDAHGDADGEGHPRQRHARPAEVQVRLQAARARLGRQPGEPIYELHGRPAGDPVLRHAAEKIFQIATGLRPEVDFSEGCAWPAVRAGLCWSPRRERGCA